MSAKEAARRRGKLRAAVGLDTVALPCVRLQYSTDEEVSQAKVPGHLTPTEARLWSDAERAKGWGDYDEYYRLRRAMLLAQARRYDEERGR